MRAEEAKPSPSPSPVKKERRPLSHARSSASSVCIDSLRVSAYKIPAETPEADGTYEWDSTTIVIVDVAGGGKQGVGYTYADSATAKLIDDTLKQVVIGQDAMSVQGAWLTMLHSIRNLGRPGICAMAISGVDIALWDLKARLLNLPLVTLLGQVRDELPVYGSGGFTNYSDEQLQNQLRGWVEQGIPRVKMKIGRDAKIDQGTCRPRAKNHRQRCRVIR
jgi:L-alanine-DL-glutamate epimerase-like enolase superfamily enzyme